MKQTGLPVIVLSSLIFLIATVTMVARADAASPQFLVTWQAAKSYVPATYPGKPLPTLASPVTASVELVSGGKLINLKYQTIYWYLDGNLIGGGMGAQHVTFTPYAGTGPSTELKIQLPNYNGSLLIHTVEIPIAKPLAVIEAPYPQNQVSDASIVAHAVPFFFATPTNNLTYTWSLNGTPAQSSENPDSAQINLPAGTSVGTSFAIALTVADPTNYSSAQSTVRLTYARQL